MLIGLIILVEGSLIKAQFDWTTGKLIFFATGAAITNFLLIFCCHKLNGIDQEKSN